MKIALINENSQKKKNAFILEVLEKVAKNTDTKYLIMEQVKQKMRT